MAFKRGSYRSFQNYVYKARQQHIELGHVWTDQLELAMKRCIRSCQRGVGPARQTGLLPVENLTCTKWPEGALVQGGPLGCFNL
eukprot:6465556-Amphidinium_carterae.1